MGQPILKQVKEVIEYDAMGIEALPMDEIPAVVAGDIQGDEAASEAVEKPKVKPLRRPTAVP